MLKLLKKIQLYSEFIESVIADIEKARKTQPNETLIIHNNNGRLSLYINSNNTPHYVSLSNIDAITPLVQKRYDIKALATLKRQKEALEKCIKGISKKNVLKELTSIYESFPEELKPMIKPHRDFNGEYARIWQNKVFRKSNISTGTNFKTKNGEFVRSKSEMLIANKLYDASIPYHYEVPFYADGKFFSRPDFYILNPRTKKEYLWEHFGRVGDAVYLEETLNKIEVYANNGFVLGDNFIASFESKEHSLNFSYVDKIVDTLLK